MKKTTFSLFGSVLFLIVILGAFYYVWNSGMQGSKLSTTSAISEFAPVDISDMKTSADSLIKGRENNATLPIPTPTSKLGKANPFNAPE